MTLELQQKVRLFQITTAISVLVGLVAFSYNVWRMEITENNSNTRTASFEILRELAELEQLIYAAHYDNNLVLGNPRNGWVIVGLVNDLSVLTSGKVETSAQGLKDTWASHSSLYTDNRDSVDTIVYAIDELRAEIKGTLTDLK